MERKSYVKAARVGFKRIMLTTATKGKDDKASRIFITNLWNDVKHL